MTGSTTPQLRLGVVGCARIFPAHLRGLKALRDAGLADIRITALCARRLDDAKTFRLRGEGPPPRPPVSDNPQDPLGAPHMYVSDLQPEPLPALFDKWEKMLDADDVDAVLILAPVGLHHTIALDCLSAGKHVFIEKPFAISVRAGQRIIDEAKKRGLVVGVAESVRYVEAIRANHWVLNQGLIGDPQMWASGWIGNDWSPNKIVARTPWRHRKLEAGGGGAIDIGVHLFHHVRYLMGPIDEVSAYVKTLESERFTRNDVGEVIDRVTNEVEDAFFANLKFESGAVGTVFWSWAGHGEPAGMPANPYISGTTGCLRGDEVVLDDGFRGNSLDLFARRAPSDLLSRQFPGGIRDAFALEMLDFATAVTSDRPMEASGEDGVIDLAYSFTILESATLNRPVKTNDVLNGQVGEYQEEIDRHYGLL